MTEAELLAARVFAERINRARRAGRGWYCATLDESAVLASAVEFLEAERTRLVGLLQRAYDQLDARAAGTPLLESHGRGGELLDHLAMTASPPPKEST